MTSTCSERVTRKTSSVIASVPPCASGIERALRAGLDGSDAAVHARVAPAVDLSRVESSDDHARRSVDDPVGESTCHEAGAGDGDADGATGRRRAAQGGIDENHEAFGPRN